MSWIIFPVAWFSMFFTNFLKDINLSDGLFRAPGFEASQTSSPVVWQVFEFWILHHTSRVLLNGYFLSFGLEALVQIFLIFF